MIRRWQAGPRPRVTNPTPSFPVPTHAAVVGRKGAQLGQGLMPGRAGIPVLTLPHSAHHATAPAGWRPRSTGGRKSPTAGSRPRSYTFPGQALACESKTHRRAARGSHITAPQCNLHAMSADNTPGKQHRHSNRHRAGRVASHARHTTRASAACKRCVQALRASAACKRCVQALRGGGGGGGRGKAMRRELNEQSAPPSVQTQQTARLCLRVCVRVHVTHQSTGCSQRLCPVPVW